jgi:hypothetical protein
MINKRVMTFIVMCLLVAPASAQDKPTGGPSASVVIQQLQVAFIGSGSFGGGELTYGGRSYPISVSGLGVGGFGASRLTASGTVYGLKQKADFAGAYLQVRTGWALGDEGAGKLWLRNDKGVTMRLKSRRQGLHLSLGADGIVIAFK